MSIRRLSTSDTLGVAREQPVVCVPVYGAGDLFRRCLQALLDHTPPTVHVLVADDATPGKSIEGIVVELAADVEHPVTYARQPRNVGFVANVNTLFAMTAPGDVVLLNSDCLVTSGWLERLHDAAYSDSLIATASALTNHATILSVPDRNRPLPDFPPPIDFAVAADAVREQSLRLRPRIPTALGHCLYVRRAALDLVGGFDLAFSPGYGEEVDFSQRCVLQGLSHVAADDVLVRHLAGSSFGGSALRIRERHERLLEQRYPFYARAVRLAAASTTGPLPRSLSVARRALVGLSVTIDARILGPHMTGTQLHALEVIAAVWRTKSVRMRVVVPPNVGAYAVRLLDQLEGIDLLTSDDLLGDVTPTDIVHRPYQVFDRSDLQVLHRLGERIIVTHQDLIAYRNPGYFDEADAWFAYQHLTRETLLLADRVVFFSQHAADDTLAEGLIDPEKLRVVYVGTDHTFSVDVAPRRPPNVPEGTEFLFCLGTNFRHKNRVFALRVLDALRSEHRWDGMLVFAGPHAAGGTSEADEAAYLAGRPELDPYVVDLESVDEAEKAWLYRNTALVVYPTIYEGFGLIPFEAAAAGAPCLFASQTSLAETLPREAALIIPWDASATAERAIEVIRSAERRRTMVELVQAASRRFRWDDTGRALVETYYETVSAPTSQARDLWAGEPPQPMSLPTSYPGIVSRFPLDVQRALVAFAAHERTRRLFFSLVRMVFVVGHVLRHRARPRRLPG